MVFVNKYSSFVFDLVYILILLFEAIKKVSSSLITTSLIFSFSFILISCVIFKLELNILILLLKEI